MGVQVRNHGVDCGVLSFEAERVHCGLQFARVDPSVAICVKQCKGFADLLDLVLGEAWSLENAASDGRSLASSLVSSLSTVHFFFLKCYKKQSKSIIKQFTKFKFH